MSDRNSSNRGGHGGPQSGGGKAGSRGGKKGGSKGKSQQSNEPKQNANLVLLGTREGVATAAPAPSVGQSSRPPNTENVAALVEFDPAWPPPLQGFYNRNSLRIGSLKPGLRSTGVVQINQLIRNAIEENFIDSNNWDNQIVPILDGGGILKLDCLLPATAQGAGASNGAAPAPPFVPDRRQNNTTNQNNFRKDQNTKKQSKNNNNNNKNSRGPKGKMNNTNGGQKRYQSNYDSEERKRARLERFKDLRQPAPISTFYETKDSGLPIVGTSTALEKEYMRLTSDARPENVRPENILCQSLPFVLEKFSNNEKYNIISQLKSIRQDLVVQHIKSDFTILVYETNARISIKKEDLGDFNQCSQQLKQLYSTKRKLDPTLQDKFYLHELEQILYNLIYMIATKNNSEVSRLHLKLLLTYDHFRLADSEKIVMDFIKSLFKVQSSILEGDYEPFFQLATFNSFPETQTAFKFLKDQVLPEIRIKALYSMSHTFAAFDLALVAEKLRMTEGTDKETTRACHKYLHSIGLGAFIDKNLLVLLSKVRPVLRILVGKFNKVDIKGQQ
ncbi:Protein THP3 [Candida viswanathii]|uniref:Protein THP3 n=1 Tax=Candida viswanathii TaxID=5486 RepID=A0A367XR76_9ASCO|nr:Protein THP3 [Candida viswanathii]